MTRRRLPQVIIAAPTLLFCAFAPRAAAQGATDLLRRDPELVGRGWRGFLDFEVLGEALLALLLATALGAAVAFFPRRHRTAESLQEAEIPKVLVLYAVIGAVIGIMVLEYGLVVGFVIFGIGGLTRFRSNLPSPPDTGRLILITLIGLACGLALPHLAVLTTLFGLAMFAVLDAQAIYHIDVKGVQREDVGSAAAAYRGVLEQMGCRVLSEQKSFAKEQVTFIFRAPRDSTRERLQHRLATEVPPALRGAVDWEVD